MHVQVLTIFPELFAPFLETSLIGRARAVGTLSIDVEDIRDFTRDRHRSVDDEPYGGGGGMVMNAEPLIAGVRALAARVDGPVRTLSMSPQGRRLDEAGVRRLAAEPALILLCGRYEGIDQRVLETVVDEEISLGDFVLSGGELPAMVLIEAISRQLPGVVGLEASVEHDSFRHGLLDYPHYTRPREVEGLPVPPVLLSGDHAQIRAWRHRESLRATLVKRPDLLPHARLAADDLEELEGLARELRRPLPAGLHKGR